MDNVFSNMIKDMKRRTKVWLYAVTTILLVVGLIGVFAPELVAAITNINQWPSTPVANNTTNPLTGTLTVQTGSNRLLLVAVEYETSVAAAHTVNVTYGTKPLTQIRNEVTQRQCIWVGYLKEADIAAASNTTISSTITLAGGATLTRQTIHAAVYAGVDQTTPILDSNSTNTASGTSLTFGRAITTANGGWIFYITNMNSSAAQAVTPPSGGGYTEHYDAFYTTYNLSCASKSTSGSSEASQTVGLGGTANRASLAVVSLNPMPANETLSVSNTAIQATGSQRDDATGIIMQRLQVSIPSGSTEINSLTIDDIGTAYTVGSLEIYISPTQQTTLPADAVLIGNVTNWGGTSSLIDLTSINGTQTARTLSTGTGGVAKYIYIVYDMSQGQAGNTVQSNITDVGVVSPDVGATGLNMNSNVITLTASSNTVTAAANTAIASGTAKDSDAAVLMQRFQVSCNTFSGTDNALTLNSVTMEDTGTDDMVNAVKIYIDSTSQSTLPATAVLIGSINEWNKQSISIPLVDDWGSTPADRTVLAGTPKYIYVVYSMHYADTFVPNLTVQNKVTAVGVSAPDNGVTGLSFLSNTITLLRGTWSKITACGGCHDTANITDGSSRNNPAGKFPGSHYKHTNYLGKDCSICHAKPTVFNHANGFINLTGAVGGAYSKGKAVAVSNAMPGTYGTCSGLYCHSNGTGGTLQSGDNRPIGSVTSPTWGGSTSCSYCHGKGPSYVNYTSSTPVAGQKANAHQGATHAAQTCDRCHTSVSTSDGGVTYTTYSSHNNGQYTLNSTLGYVFNARRGGTCSTPGCHVAVNWGGKLGCLDCHNTTITRTKGRPGTQLANVKGEFGLAYGHKKSTRTAVADADCIVCHLEGSYSTGKASATYHGNGNIDLRDPDGAGETPITNISGGAFTFQRFSTSYAAGSRTTNGHLSNNIDNVITQKFCLKCHDKGGATNPTARSNNGGTGTANMPFGGVNLGANYTVLNGASIAGGVVNVFSQFSTANSSIHPVRAPLNRDFPIASRLAAPYNGQGAGRVATGGTKTLSVVINCFDCHNNNAGALLTTRTISAHGSNNSRQVRGTFYVSGPTLCTACHTGYTVGDSHGSGSAMNSATGRTGEGFNGFCGNCHGSSGTDSATAPARPIPAFDFHGYNKLLSGNNWTSPGQRPFGFIRNTTNYAGTGYHRPMRSTEFTSGSATCSGGTGCAGDGSARTYTPGGQY